MYLIKHKLIITNPYVINKKNIYTRNLYPYTLILLIINLIKLVNLSKCS